MKVKKCLSKVKAPCIIFTLILTMLSNALSAAALSEFYSTDEGVSVTLTPNQESYELGEKSNFTIKITNYNDHSMKVINPEVSLNSYVIKVPFEGEVGAGETLTKAISIDLTFEQWHSVKIKDQNIKIGIQARKDVINDGSIFHVEAVNELNNNYNTYLNWVDSTSGKIEHIAFLNMGLTDSSGTSFNPTGGANVYFEIPSGWDANELQASYITPGIDEQFDEKIVEIDGVKYLCWRIDHFSPYAVIDPITKDDEDKIEDNDSKNSETTNPENPKPELSKTDDNLKTGYGTNYLVIGLIISLVSFVLIVMSLRYKKLMSKFFCFFMILSLSFYHNNSFSFFEANTYEVDVSPHQTGDLKFDGVKIKCFWCIKHPVISLKRKDSQTIITGDFNKVVLNKNNGYDYDAYDPSQEGKEVNGEFVIDSNFTENLSLVFYKDGKIIDSYYKD